ncbi:MAG: glycosyltransferase family 2 protein [Tepidisphaeraceae bacterium]|jgi:glycosyltransferase involved in cell wall biosynthesis
MMANDSQPRISVVTPSFNQGRYLDACMRSVLDQDYPNFEYMVVDGGSTDESLDVIRAHEKRLAWWVSEKDKGQSDAINKGFRRATGPIVAWLNSDDLLLPGALASAAGAYRQAPQASFWYGRCVWVDESGQRKRHYVSAPRLLFNREALTYGLNYIPQPATFINRKHLETAGYLDTSLQYAMDSELWMRLSAIAPPVAIEQTLAAAREHPQTKTLAGSFDRIEAIRKIAEKYTDFPMTPGSMCYLLDEFYRLVKQHPEVFPESYRDNVCQFWASTSALLARWGADAEGNPVKSGATTPAANMKPSTMMDVPCRGKSDENRH